MTTNWREKLEAVADQDIDDLGFVVGPEKVLLSDALAIIREARRAAFEEAARLSDGHETRQGDKIAVGIRYLAAKEGET